MMRCPEECEKQWRPVQGKSEWEKQKEEEAKETEKEKNDGDKESSRGMGDMG